MKLRSGSSIVEVVIATALISMGIMAALSLTNYSQRQNSYAKALNEATSYNNQAADWLRSEKTRLGWAAFLNKLITDSGNEYCLDILPTTLVSLSAGSCGATEYVSGTSFIREMTIIQSGANSTRATVTITTSWQEKVPRTTTLTMELSQWQ